MISATHSHDRFATTRWSMVMHMASGETADAGRALGELAQRYWYPVYAYVRHCGHAAPAAEEIARNFLQTLMLQFREGGARPPHGHFRRFLLDRLNAFLGSGGGRAAVHDGKGRLAVPGDLETRYRHDISGAGSAIEAYERSFALEVVARALRRLESEAKQTNHLEMFAALTAYLARDPPAGEYAAIAQRLECPPLMLVVALKRLRQRFRELVGQELADTVTTAEDLSNEQSALHAALRAVPGTR